MLPCHRYTPTAPGYPRFMTEFRKGDRVTAVLDIDGTLVDTNYHHALAWFRAFRRHDLDLPVWRLHRAIGMGGDQLVASLTRGRTVRMSTAPNRSPT